MIHPLLRFRFSTVAILSGGVRNNSLTKRIIQHLREEQPEIKFMGLAGANCDADFKTVFGYSQSFPKQPFQAINHYKQELQEWPLSPYMLPYHFGNRKVLKELYSHNIFEQFLRQKVSAVINVGNWSFSRLFLRDLQNFYKKRGFLKPPVFFYDRSIYNRKIQHQEIIDYQFYQLPRKPDNFGGYEFPSMCIGDEALFKVYRYLAKYRRDHTFNYKEVTSFAEETEVLIKEARKQFRNSNTVSQDTFVIAVTPGKTQEQVSFTMSRLPETITRFFQSERMIGYPIEKFEIWVIPPKQNNQLDLNMPPMKQNIKVRYLKTADRIPGLCAADVALVHNGSVTVEAAACHLPCIVLDSMSMVHAYLSLLFNRYESPLNISTQKMGYQQLLSGDSAIPDKISTLLVDHFVNPKLKYFYVDTYQQPLKDMLYMSGRNPQLNVQKSGLQTSCEMVLQEIKNYEHKNHQVISKDWRDKRLSIIQ